MPTYGDLLFGNIAVLNKVLPENVVVGSYVHLGKGDTLQDYLVTTGILTHDAAERIDYAKRYYQFKDAERVYYKLVLKNGLVPKEILQQVLQEQKRDDNRPPLYSLLLKKRYLTPNQHRGLKGEQARILNRHAAKFVKEYTSKHPSIKIDADLYDSMAGKPSGPVTPPPKPAVADPPFAGARVQAPPPASQFPSQRSPLPDVRMPTVRRSTPPPPPASSAQYLGVGPPASSGSLPSVPAAPTFHDRASGRFERPEPTPPAGLPLIPPSKAFEQQPPAQLPEPAAPPFQADWGAAAVGQHQHGFQSDFVDEEETEAPANWNSDFGAPPPPASAWAPQEAAPAPAWGSEPQAWGSEDPAPEPWGSEDSVPQAWGSEDSPPPAQAWAAADSSAQVFVPPSPAAPGAWGNSGHAPPGSPGVAMALPPPQDSGIGQFEPPPAVSAFMAGHQTGGGDPWIGQKIGAHYQIIEKIGEGGMGSVYKAKHELMSREVAIKLINPELITNDETLQRFQREIRAMSSFQNKHTVEIYDAGELPDGSCFMAMEFLDGRTLTDMVAEGAVPLKRTTELAMQILNAVNAAHEKKIVHRDLKPDNIMILVDKNNKDFVKIMDFGVAKILEEPTETVADGSPIFVSMVGTVTGTPQYMSPEQASGDKVDHRSDLYSIGVILYEMICGLLPFESQSPVGFLGQHISQQPPPFKVRVPEKNFAPPIEEIVMRLLRKSVKDRYQSAKEVIEDLELKVVPLFKKPQKKTFFSRFFGRG